MSNESLPEPVLMRQLMCTLQILAQPATIQFEYFGSVFGAIADDMANSFDHAKRCVVSNFRKKLTAQQILSLDELDQAIDQLSQPKRESVWDDLAELESDEWAQVRLLAKKCLVWFDWPNEVPPRGSW